MKYVLLGNGVVAETFLRSAPADRLKPSLIVLNRPGRQHNARGLASAAADIGVEVAECGDATRIRLIEWMRSVS
jgi:hypothetical protein